MSDHEKLKIVNYCIKNKKNVLLEKPFLVKRNKILTDLEKHAQKQKVVCYTAYNHRFEPSIKKMKNLIKCNKLGKIYKCRIFYGNGTSLLVKNLYRFLGKSFLDSPPKNTRSILKTL